MSPAVLKDRNSSLYSDSLQRAVGSTTALLYIPLPLIWGGNGGGNSTSNGDSSSGDNSGWNAGRWVLLALLVAFAVFLLAMTFAVNIHRNRTGRAPVVGTAWAMPPSYRQSERQHNNQGEQNEDYVPQYTETANDQDMGYYDQRGQFHVNDKTAAASNSLATTEGASTLEVPPPAVVVDSSIPEHSGASNLEPLRPGITDTRENSSASASDLGKIEPDANASSLDANDLEPRSSSNSSEDRHGGSLRMEKPKHQKVVTEEKETTITQV